MNILFVYFGKWTRCFSWLVAIRDGKSLHPAQACRTHRNVVRFLWRQSAVAVTEWRCVAQAEGLEVNKYNCIFHFWSIKSCVEHAHLNHWLSTTVCLMSPWWWDEAATNLDFHQSGISADWNFPHLWKSKNPGGTLVDKVLSREPKIWSP